MGRIFSNIILGIGVFIFFLCINVLSASFVGSPEDRQTAYVDKIKGIYIFLVTDPVNEYKILGDVKMPGFVWDGKTVEMLDNAVTRAKKQHPSCTGVLIEDYKFESVKAIQVSP